jgi:uncharacterized protein (DUF1330 family)
MVKGYWIAIYHAVADPAVLERYAEAATPILLARGARILVRGKPTQTFEGGIGERCVVIEFPSVAQAIATYESDEYQAVLAIMRGAVVREVRIAPGAEG